jgi:hypothetical protein
MSNSSTTNSKTLRARKSCSSLIAKRVVGLFDKIIGNKYTVETYQVLRTKIKFSPDEAKQGVFILYGAPKFLPASQQFLIISEKKTDAPVITGDIDFKTPIVGAVDLGIDQLHAAIRSFILNPNEEALDLRLALVMTREITEEEQVTIINMLGEYNIIAKFTPGFLHALK